MPYYARATCGVEEVRGYLEGTLKERLYLGEYVKFEASDWASQGACFQSGGARFMLGCPCEWLERNGHWEYLTKDMFTPEEVDVLQMLLPDLEWYKG